PCEAIDALFRLERLFGAFIRGRLLRGLLAREAAQHVVSVEDLEDDGVLRRDLLRGRVLEPIGQNGARRRILADAARRPALAAAEPAARAQPHGRARAAQAAML